MIKKNRFKNKRHIKPITQRKNRSKNGSFTGFIDDEIMKQMPKTSKTIFNMSIWELIFKEFKEFFCG